MWYPRTYPVHHGVWVGWNGSEGVTVVRLPEHLQRGVSAVLLTCTTHCTGAGLRTEVKKFQNWNSMTFWILTQDHLSRAKQWEHAETSMSMWRQWEACLFVIRWHCPLSRCWTQSTHLNCRRFKSFKWTIRKQHKSWRGRESQSPLRQSHMIKIYLLRKRFR